MALKCDQLNLQLRHPDFSSMWPADVDKGLRLPEIRCYANVIQVYFFSNNQSSTQVAKQMAYVSLK